MTRITEIEPPSIETDAERAIHQSPRLQHHRQTMRRIFAPRDADFEAMLSLVLACAWAEGYDAGLARAQDIITSTEVK